MDRTRRQTHIATATAYEVAPALLSLLPRYRAYLVGEKRRPQGVDRYLWALRRYATWLGSEPTLADVTAASCRRYKEALGEAGMANGTIINALSAIRDFSIWAIGEGLRTDEPTAGIRRPPKRRPDPNPLYEDEVALLMGLLDEPMGLDSHNYWYWRRNARALALFLYTGMRLSEIAGLKWRHVKMGANVIEVRGDAGAKNGKDRAIPIHPRLRSFLDAAPTHTPDQPVVGRIDKRHLSASGLAKVFDSWVAERIAALPEEQRFHVYPHRMRHTFASILVWNDVDLRTLQELLGHAQLGTTEHYVKVKDSQKRAAIAKMPDFTRPEKNDNK